MSVTTYYLEMTSPSSLQAKPQPEGLSVVEAELKEFRLNRYLYQLVGEPWEWRDKLSLSDEQWREYAERDAVRTWVAYYRGTIAGYFELVKETPDEVEIMYFGLAPKFVGKGFGGYLLSQAIEAAWSWEGTKRVWVHTCTLDHEAALANYKSRGMTLYKTEVE